MITKTKIISNTNFFDFFKKKTFWVFILLCSLLKCNLISFKLKSKSIVMLNSPFHFKISKKLLKISFFEVNLSFFSKKLNFFFLKNLFFFKSISFFFLKKISFKLCRC